MTDIKIKFNLESEEVEIWNGEKKEVAIESDIFQSWVTAYNDKHGFVKPVEVEETTSTEEVTNNDNKEEPKEEAESSTEG